MEFIDLKKQQELIRKKLEQNINRVLEHGKYINGPEVSELEKRLAEFVGVSYAIGVSSGTDALIIPLMAYEVGTGDAIFTTTFTFIATAEVIRLLGATPVFVDIDPKTYNIDADNLEMQIKKVLEEDRLRPKGVIPVDLFGQSADYEEIGDVARKYDLFVLEDGAQSFGGSYRGRRTCSLSEVGVTSFFPAKPLGCYGDGGMIFTSNRDLCEKMMSIRVHGQGIDKYDNVRIGINGRLDTLQAAILLAKLEIFEEEIRLRQEVAQSYNRMLNGHVTLPFVKEGNMSVWAQYSVLHHERTEKMTVLKEHNIPTAIYYPKPLHLQRAFSGLGYQEGCFPVAERVSKEIFSLPMHPHLTVQEQELIARSLSGGIG